MFKAKLVSDDKYYDWRKKTLLIGIPFFILIGIVSNFFLLSLTQALLLLLIFIPIIYFGFTLQHKMLKAISEKVIEINEEKITIKSAKGSKSQEIYVNDIEEIEITDGYGFAGENMSDILNEMNGNHLKNVLQIRMNGRIMQYKFIIESYYMIEQLKKIILQWKSKGINIHALN